MKSKQSFLHTVCELAIPVALQSMLQSSFSIIDQVMLGQLGSVSIAGVGFAGKFSSIFSVVVSAVGAVAGIMISQYLGQKNDREVKRSFYLNLLLAFMVALFFTIGCVIFSEPIMGLYTKDEETRRMAASYLQIIAGTFFPIAGATLLSTLYRCVDQAKLPLYASIASALCNTGFNYIFIFGKCGCSSMGAKGAAIATLISQVVNVLLMLFAMPKSISHQIKSVASKEKKVSFDWKQYGAMLFPILVCEVMWSLGENVYAIIYGHLGTEASAAMTLINPVQGLMIGALCGISSAASIIVGKMLGNEAYEEAYQASKKLLLYGLVGSLILSAVVVLTRGSYVQIYQVEESVKILTKQILFAYALVAPMKVLNMILGGGIIRSGGKTKYVMIVDIIGTWGFGVPLGLFTAFVCKLSIPYVYFFLSLEEGIRFLISLVVFRRKKWMQKL